MIEFLGITKRFGPKTAVDRLQLTVPKGEFFAFLGPNGAGKTTSIKVLVGLLRPDDGRVRVCGYDVAERPVEAKARVSYVPDQPYLYDKLSGREFLEFVARMYRLEPRKAAERISALSERLSLGEFMDELTEGYSHGMKQRVVIAAALLHEPEVMIVDEPMVGLDPRSIRVVKDILSGLARSGVTIFMSTHTLAVAEELADRIGIINHGRLIALGTQEELHKAAGREEGLEDLFLRLTDDEGEE